MKKLVHGIEPKLLYSSYYNTKFDVDIHKWAAPHTDAHGHDFYEFEICDKGEYLHYKNGEKPVLIKKKQAIFITPDDVHSVTIKKQSFSLLNISITQKLFFEICEYLGVEKSAKVLKNDTITLSDEEFKYLKKQIESIFATDRERVEETLYRSELKYLAVNIFNCFLKRKNQDPDIPKWLTDFIAEICTPELFGCRAFELYKYSNYSQPVVSRAFQKYYGMTFIQFFTQKKIAYACGLLKNTDTPILEISNNLAFSSLSHFCRTFKKLTGFSPNCFRHMK